MFDIPKVTLPEASKKYIPSQVKLTLQEIKELSDDELLMLLSGENRNGVIPAPLLQAISYELTSRQIKRSSKPHWNVYAILILTFIAAAASVIAILK